jgi:hypothetical protein
MSFRFSVLFWIPLICLSLTGMASGYTLGLEQTFGSNGYNGTRVPFTLVHTKLDETNVKWLDFNIGFDTYQDDFVRKRYFAFEPKLEIYSESQAAIFVSSRLVPTTDDFSFWDIGVGVRYTALPPRNDADPPRAIDEVEVGFEIRRRAYSDNVDINYTPLATSFSDTEVQLIATVSLLHDDWGSPKPKVRTQLSKSFYSSDISPTNRPAPMTSILGLTPFVQGYVNAMFNTTVWWTVGRPDGFSLEPQVFYSFYTPYGSGDSGNAVGFGLHVKVAGFGVKVDCDLLKEGALDWRSFLTLGASFTF